MNRPRITIDNYEPYALDYLEGQLTPEAREEFENFLALHPDIATDIQQMEIIPLPPPEHVIYPKADKLLQPTHRRPNAVGMWIARAAVVLILLTSVLWLVPPQDDALDYPLASTTTEPKISAPHTSQPSMVIRSENEEKATKIASDRETRDMALQSLSTSSPHTVPHDTPIPHQAAPITRDATPNYPNTEKRLSPAEPTAQNIAHIPIPSPLHYTREELSSNQNTYDTPITLSTLSSTTLELKHDISSKMIRTIAPSVRPQNKKANINSLIPDGWTEKDIVIADDDRLRLPSSMIPDAF